MNGCETIQMVVVIECLVLARSNYLELVRFIVQFREFYEFQISVYIYLQITVYDCDMCSILRLNIGLTGILFQLNWPQAHEAFNKII